MMVTMERPKHEAAICNGYT